MLSEQQIAEGWLKKPYAHCCAERDGDPAFAHLILANKAALAPFTKGQNDE